MRSRGRCSGSGRRAGRRRSNDWHRHLLARRGGCHLRRRVRLRRIRLQVGELKLELIQRAPGSEDWPNRSCRSFLIVNFSFSIRQRPVSCLALRRRARSSPHYGPDAAR